MYQVQKLVMENVYCSPGQDRQFNFTLLKVTKDNLPITKSLNIYGTVKTLPDNTTRFHVFTLGNLPSVLVNLVYRKNNWIKNIWYNVSTDSTAREYIMQLYTEEGKVFPSAAVWYSRTDEDGLVIAVESKQQYLNAFPIEDIKFLRVYSNNYYTDPAFTGQADRYGITVHTSLLENDVAKANAQIYINNTKSARGGDFICFVNGLYTKDINLHVEDYSYAEMIHDQSIISVEDFPISSLRTFMSEKDPGRLKYFIHRDKIVDDIQFDDDIEVYIVGQNGYLVQGLYFYSHSASSIRNVTDKDFSLDSEYVNNTAQALSDIIGGSINDKTIRIYTRKSTVNRKLMFNSTKLHELYKLPQSVELDVMSNTGYSISEMRVEKLENSDYFDVVNADGVGSITKEMAYDAMGYNGVRYYLASPKVVGISNTNTYNVPILYREPSTVYEHYGECPDLSIARGVTSGPVYTAQHPETGMLEFIYGICPDNYGRLYTNQETITLKPNSEYRILSALYNGINRLTNWVDITDNQTKVTKTETTVVLNELPETKVKIVYMNEPYIKDYVLDKSEGVLSLTLTVEEDRGEGMNTYPLDTFYSTVEVFMNSKLLAEGIDYDMNFPFISICNKGHIDFTKEEQTIHVRCHGMALTSREDINKNDIVGFITNGVATANGKYDIRDDRGFRLYVNGFTISENSMAYAESQIPGTTISTFNGSVYVLSDNFISLKTLTGLDTKEAYEKNVAINKKISDLYDIINPEPVFDNLSPVANTNYLFSPTVSLILKRMLDGSIPSTTYTSQYNDGVILNLINSYPYADLLALDPVKKAMPSNMVTIHPCIAPPTVEVNLHMYRFLTDVVRVITQGQITKVNLSAYLTVSSQDVTVSTPGTGQYGGIIIV